MISDAQEFFSFALSILGAYLIWWLCTSFLQYFQHRRYASNRGCQDPPSVSAKDPIFGLDYALRLLSSVNSGSRGLSLREGFEKLGTTYSTNVYGVRKIMTADPNNIQAVFSKNTAAFGVEAIRNFTIGPIVGEGVMSMDGKVWSRSRALMQPMVSKTAIVNFDSLSLHVRNLIDGLPKDLSTVDMQDWFASLGLDMVTEFLFGRSFGLLTGQCSDNAKEFLAAWKTVHRGMGRRTHIPKSNVFHWDKEFWTSCKVVRTFVEGVVHNALESKSTGNSVEPKHYVMVSDLVRRLKNTEDIVSQLLNVFLAGYDTTAILLSNAFFNFARYPTTFTKLRDEVKDENEITYSSLQRLPYLQKVIKETLRLNPPVGTMSRVVVNDMTVLPQGGGVSGKTPVFMKKGDLLQASFYTLQRNKAIYGEDAETFNPDRWDGIAPSSWEFLPFGGGPRVCPGRNLAMVQAQFVLVRMLQAFGGIENRDPVFDFVELFKLVTESKNGVKVALRPSY
ncbi:hypothetical protein VTL71DRAFT_15540 [Oculimacula yallundae]|uniref:Cytochrome P450 n=1 Tax=Oculimacula yallundae TaxID=86028 RepID=A0ABR4CGV9_9HELO